MHKQKKYMKSPVNEVKNAALNINESTKEELDKIIALINNSRKLFYNCKNEILTSHCAVIKEKPNRNIFFRLCNGANINEAIDCYNEIHQHYPHNLINKNNIEYVKQHIYDFDLIYDFDSNFNTLIILNDKTDLSNEDRNEILDKCMKYGIHLVTQNGFEFTDIFDLKKYILSHSTYMDSGEQCTEYHLNKVELQKIDYTAYEEDSFLLLSMLKDNVNCSDSKIFSETEKERLDKKLSSIKENHIFESCRYSKDIFPIREDGIGESPEINWIMVKENVSFTEAVNLYIEMKEYLNHCESNGVIKSFDLTRIWRYKTTFFVTEEDIQLPADEKDEFIKKCRMNNIHIVKHPKEFEFIDVFDSTKYILDYSTYSGSADDAATYVYYYMMKIDSEIKTEKEKLSDKILNKILCSYCNKKYFNDISLNQINIKTTLDENRLYFLTVYVDAATGIINKFSFDIESACDTHYEFDLSGAEKLREMCCERIPDIDWNIAQSLDKVMIKYLNKFDESSLVSLIESVATAVFHFD